MEAMKAMDYEYLIRAVFKCGRTRRFGADADIFRAYNPIPLNATHASSMHLSISSNEGSYRYSRHLSIFEVNSLFSLYCSCTSYNATCKYAATSPILKPSLYWSTDS